MDGVVFIECNEETLLVLINDANAFIRHKNAVFYAWPFYQSVLSLLFRMQEKYDHRASKLVET